MDELDEACEITFVHKGRVGVGYEINKIKKLCIQYNDKCVIGAFNATFGQRSEFIFCTVSEIESYFIRKHLWLAILEEFESISEIMKRKIIDDYYFRLKYKILRMKKNSIQDIMNRNDY